MVKASNYYSEGPGFNPQLGPVVVCVCACVCVCVCVFFSSRISLLSEKDYHLEEFTIDLV